MAGILFNIATAPFEPSGTPTAHYAADSIIGLSDDDPLATWNDIANSNDLGQATPAERPLYKQNIQNNLPAVYLDTNLKSMQESSINLSQPLTVFCAVKRTATAVGQIWDGVTSRALFGEWSGFYKSYAGAFLDTGIAVDTDAHIWVVQYNGFSSVIRQDGVEVANGSGGSANLTHLMLGRVGGSSQTCYVFEMLIYSGLENPTANEAGLAKKWGI